MKPFLYISLLFIASTQVSTVLGSCPSTKDDFPKECWDFCERHRPSGNKGAFSASCNVPLEVSNNGFCVLECEAAKCPDECCGNGQSVQCPAYAEPTPPPNPKNDQKGKDLAIWLIVLIVLLVLLCCVGVGLCVWCACKSQRRQRFPQLQSRMAMPVQGQGQVGAPVAQATMSSGQVQQQNAFDYPATATTTYSA